MCKRSFCVLMWKHCIVRKRRFINTAVELAYPILLFVLLFAFKDDLFLGTPKNSKMNGLDQKIHETEPFKLMDAPKIILYYPDTPITSELMQLVGNQLRMSRLPQLPDPSEYMGSGRGYYPIAEESQAMEYATNEKYAVILFQDMADGALPDKLKYIIRMKGYFNTDGYLPSDLSIEPHYGYGANYEKFLRLQWAIDTSFIKQKANVDIPQALTLHEFPYLSQDANSHMSIVCPVVQVISYLSLFISFVFLMSRLLHERTTGIQELIKMVGVPMSTLSMTHFVNVLPAALIFSIVGTVLLKVSSSPLVPNSSGVLIFIFMLLYFVSVISLAFACSYLIKNGQYATTLSVFAFMASQVPSSVVSHYQLPRWVLPLAGFLPHHPLKWFWMEILQLEQYGKGLDFATMWQYHSIKSCSAFLAILFVIIQSSIFWFVAWYLSLVCPGQYGSPLPWNFLFQPQYWKSNEVNPQISLDDEDHSFAKDGRYFEEAPDDAEVGISIVNVTKVFPKHVALKNVSLNVYKGEITVLLGHNGAGKTTLMSIITGMLTATQGKVYVDGMDTATQLTAIRRNMGLCPQHNLFFPDLTVVEHIIFFTMLKNSSYNEACNSARTLANKLGIGDKINVLCNDLSGGMKRRVQLACALAGDSQILILDEPTSGLDVETRRELWNLLLSLRGHRTVLLTTHFMEEADALGDRVAALHAGHVTCHATTMYLKKAIGTGYRLTLTTIGVPLESQITSTVVSYVKDAAVKETTINSISFNLPATASKKFSKLFSALEAMKSDLQIDSIGVGVSTLEEVFLKLCSDTDRSGFDDETDGPGQYSMFKRVTGCTLYFNQFKALICRQFKYLLYRKWAFLILEIIIPILLICVTTQLCNTPEGSPSVNQLSIDVDMYRDGRVLYEVPLDYDIDTLSKKHSDVVFESSNNFDDVVLRAAKADVNEYQKYVAGISLNDTDAVIRYTTTVRHALPVALNLLTNLLATKYIPGADGLTFQTVNFPIPNVQPYQDQSRGIVQPKSTSGYVWSFIVCLVVLSTLINLSSLPCRERLTGTRHIHLMSGCAPELLWGTTLVWHTFVAAVTLILPVVVVALALETEKTLDQPDFLAAVTVVFLLGILAFFASMYLVSFYCSDRVCSVILVTGCLLFGLVTPASKSLIEIMRDDESIGFLYYVGVISSYLMPPHALVEGTLYSFGVAKSNAYCKLNRAKCPNLPPISVDYDVSKCCAGQNPSCYFCLEDKAPGKIMIILTIQFVVYMTMVILTQRGIFSYIFERIMNSQYTPMPQPIASQSVVDEKAYVDKAFTLPSSKIGCSDSMLVQNLHKRYTGVPIFTKPFAAVKGVNFSVKIGECFGLLGVNGAGKSSTFKMLTAEACPTRGHIFANERHMGLFNSSYLQTLGYCPQFFGLDYFMTGKDNLALVLMLRGHSSKSAAEEAKNWINVVGLEKYQHRSVEGYSGGCVRRLGAAAALCSGGKLTMLDEPTAGVDVSARRRVWAALRRGLRDQRSVIITSHSMDEMEALCGRIAIMSAGQICALGSAAQLRAAHAEGHAVVLKVRPAPSDEVDGMASGPKRLKEKFHTMFPCTLKDEHKTMLHYHINQTMQYSTLFKNLEALKQEFPDLLEDYSVTETTLEEVFLSFAKQEQQQV